MHMHRPRQRRDAAINKDRAETHAIPRSPYFQPRCWLEYPIILFDTNGRHSNEPVPTKARKHSDSRATPYGDKPRVSDPGAFIFIRRM